MNDATIKFRLPSAELEEWKRKAGENGESLSEWVRGRCNEERSAVPDVQRVEPVREAKRREPAADAMGQPCDHDFGYGPGKCPYAHCRNANPKAVARCKHGTEKGYRCWQCGGKAVTE
jgi:hypothetical protein